MRKLPLLPLFLLTFALLSCSQDTKTTGANVTVQSVSIHAFQYKELNNSTPKNGQKIMATVYFKTTGTPTLPEGGYPYKMYMSYTPKFSDAIQLTTTLNAIPKDKFGTEEKVWGFNASAQLPIDVQSGTVYIFFVGDPDNTIVESSHTDNSGVNTITVEQFTSAGAFKVYNSWGNSWDTNISGGYYYLPFEKATDLGTVAYFHNNTQTNAYSPVIVASFKIDSDDPMQDFTTEFILNDNTASEKTIAFPYATSEQARLPYTAFPDETITFDLSDFASDLRDESGTISLYIHGSSNSATATIKSFSVSYYENGYSQNATQTFTCDNPELNIESVKVNTINVDPVLRSTRQTQNFTSRALTETEKQELNDLFPDTPVTIDGRGTGLIKESNLSAYDDVLLAIPLTSGSNSFTASSFTDYRTTDLSLDTHFPPYGNQGSVGSCTAWSTTYYVMTHEMATENDWDLSGVSWDATNKTPSGETNHIMSPAFTYHLCNGGLSGSTNYTSSKLLSTTGCCTWDKMGTTDVYEADSQDTKTPVAMSLPSEDAWAEAPNYRLANMPTPYYLSIKDEASLKVVMDEIKNNHCVSFALDGYSLYNLFNKNGVMIGDYVVTKHELNHAQTIVGYVLGDDYTKLLTE